MDRHAWRAVRDVGARVLHAALGARRGAAAEWARRLGLADASKISEWTGLDLTKSPTIADVLLMERDDALRFLRGLLRELTPAVAPSELMETAVSLIEISAEALRETRMALKDGRLDAREVARLYLIADKLEALAEKLRAVRACR